MLITVVEDEPAIAEVLEYNLGQAGFDVDVVNRGDGLLPAIERRRPDLILLDLMLPGLSGVALMRMLKAEPATADVPLIMLTARSEEIDRVVGFELGADDYITKPFSPREVVLRVQAVLRRAARSPADAAAPAVEPAVIEAGSIRIDVAGHRAFVEETEVSLTATEFRLLRVLAERQGRVQTRERLLRDVWGYAEDLDSRTVDTHVRRLRSKLGDAAERIATVIGVGYRLESDASTSTE